MKRLLTLLCTLLLLSTCAAAQEPETITISFIGDCSIGDSLQYRDYTISYHSTIREQGPEWPFSLVEDVLKACREDLRGKALLSVALGKEDSLCCCREDSLCCCREGYCNCDNECK